MIINDIISIIYGIKISLDNNGIFNDIIIKHYIILTTIDVALWMVIRIILLIATIKGKDIKKISHSDTLMIFITPLTIILVTSMILFIRNYDEIMGDHNGFIFGITTFFMPLGMLLIPSIIMCIYGHIILLKNKIHVLDAETFIV